MADTDKSFWSRWDVVLTVFVVVASLIIAGAYASYTVISSDQNPADHGLVVKIGDTINVEYIGMFEDGTVFDTSMRKIAENNTQYPKSLSFTPRTEYYPMSFTVGTGQMIPGFDKGVIGMAVNQTKVLTIPPEKGYGSRDENLIESRNLSESIPILQWFGNRSSFIETYMIDPNVGTNVKNNRYGWNMTVFHVDELADMVMVKNNPLIGETVISARGWRSRVVSMDSSENMGSGEIVLRHLMSNDDVGKKVFTDEDGRQFTIANIDTALGTYTADFNMEVVGRTLIFKVTVVSITPVP